MQFYQPIIKYNRYKLNDDLSIIFHKNTIYHLRVDQQPKKKQVGSTLHSMSKFYYNDFIQECKPKFGFFWQTSCLMSILGSYDYY